MRECPTCQRCLPDAAGVCPQDGDLAKATIPGGIVVGDRYRLETRLGQGSVSIVYRAQDLVSSATMAVKVALPQVVGSDRELAQRMLAEITAASKIKHPNVVGIIESGLIEQTVPFVVMEFVSGVTLHELLSDHRCLSPAEALEYVSAIGAGLAAAHANKIVHGDLKPRNILLEADRSLSEGVKILDFGMSAIKAGKLQRAVAGQSPKGLLRSALYLAPEEWSDEDEPDHRSDIYSLGVILYQMLSGSVPFKGKSNPAIMKEHLITAPPPLVTADGPVAPEIERVVFDALEKDPNERPASAKEFIDELRNAIEAPRTSKRKTAPAKKNKLAKPPIIEEEGEDEGRLPDETIVLSSAALKRERDLIQPDFNSTIVLPGRKRELALEESALDESALDELEEEEADFIEDHTSADDLNDQEDDYEEYEPEELDASESELDESFVSQPDQLPKTMSPAFLAIGVIVVIVLIAVGIYYSRISQ